MAEEQTDVLDDRELAELDQLRARYEKMTAPGMLAKAGEKIASILPVSIREAAENAGEAITEQQFYAEAMKTIAVGFKTLEAQAAKVTVSEKTVVEKANKLTSGRAIESLDELCFVRSYEVAKIANS